MRIMHITWGHDLPVRSTKGTTLEVSLSLKETPTLDRGSSLQSNNSFFEIAGFLELTVTVSSAKKLLQGTRSPLPPPPRWCVNRRFEL